MRLSTSNAIPVSSPSVTDAETASVVSALSVSQLTYGPYCHNFESALAQLLGTKHAVVTSSGTTALHLVLAALGCGPGDEVIVPDITFVATANAVLYTGATPVIVDVDPSTWCISPSAVERAITPRTRAMIPVHLYGVPCDIDALRDLSRHYAVDIVEDAAEGLGGYYHDGRPLGSNSVAGVFSFYANKIITTGEGGAVVCSSDYLHRRLCHLRGQAMSTSQRYFHTEVGYNYRLTDMQAAIGLTQLSRLPTLLAARRVVIDRYAATLRLPAPCTAPNCAPWLYTALLPNGITRSDVEFSLSVHDIETRPCFSPLHRMPHFGALPDNLYPVASYIADHALSLPTYPDLTIADVDRIVEIVNGVLSA